MSAKQPQQTADTIRLSAMHLRVGRRIAVENLADLTVAKAADQVLALLDGLQELRIVFAQGIQAAITATVLPTARHNGALKFSKGVGDSTAANASR